MGFDYENEYGKEFEIVYVNEYGNEYYGKRYITIPNLRIPKYI